MLLLYHYYIYYILLCIIILLYIIIYIYIYIYIYILEFNVCKMWNIFELPERKGDSKSPCQFIKPRCFECRFYIIYMGNFLGSISFRNKHQCQCHWGEGYNSKNNW